MTSPLLHRPIPFDDESPGSFLLRISESNGWKSPSSLLIANKYRYSSNSTVNIESIMCNQKKWDEVLKSFGITTKSALAVCYNRLGLSYREDIELLGASMPWGKLRLQTPAICPVCIAENKYHKAIWDFKLITTCSQHKVKLINSCPNCSKRISWNRQNLSQCKCGYEFEKSVVEESDCDVTRYFETLIHNRDMTKLNFLLTSHSIYSEFYHFTGDTITEHDLANLCMLSVEAPDKAIGIIQKSLETASNTFSIHPRLALHPFLSSDIQGIQSIAQSCLEEYQYKPSDKKYFKLEGKLGFTTASYVLGVSPFFTKALVREKVLVPYLDNNTHQSLVITLDSLNKFLHQCSKGSRNNISSYKFESIKALSHTYQYCHKFIDLIINIVSGRKEYSGRNVLASGIKGILIEPVKKDKAVIENGIMTLKMVAQLCNIHYENIRFAVHVGVLKRISPNETKGTSISIYKNDADEFNKRYIFSGSIAKQHDCTPYNLAEKIFTTGVKAISGPSIDGGLTYLFKRVDINILDIKAISNIKNYPTQTGRKAEGHKLSDENSLSLTKVSQMLNISPQKASLLLRNKYLLEHANLGREKRVTPESVQHILNARNARSLIDIATAAGSIKESEQQFRIRWLQTNFIEFINTGLNIYITKNDLQKIKRFKSKFVIAKEASALTGIGTIRIRALKNNNTLKLHKQLGNGQKKVIFYNKKEVISICSDYM